MKAKVFENIRTWCDGLVFAGKCMRCVALVQAKIAEVSLGDRKIKVPRKKKIHTFRDQPFYRGSMCR